MNKTIFVLNPHAGHGECIEKFINSIKSAAAEAEEQVEIYITKAIGDARRFVKRYCEENGGARFIACGGDGTLSEVLNGAIEYDSAEIGVIPVGTGNDFCRNFADNCHFRNILLQINGKSMKCDAIKYTTFINGIKKEGYCANMFNIGFDCNVVDMKEQIKNKIPVGGPLAYFLSILLTLVRKKSSLLKVELDGVVHHDEELLLTAIANGSYCGGGVKSNPLASINDGFININIIKNVSRLKFISLLPYYMKGNFLNLRNIDKYIFSGKCRSVTLTPQNGSMKLCVDGEIIDAGRTHFEIVHNAFNFVVPSQNTEDINTCDEDMFAGIVK